MKKNILQKESDDAIKVENISKTFRIPHDKNASIKGAALNLLRAKSYTEFKALDDVSFEIKKGEFFGIIGRNGSGKSTLLKVLAKIYVPDKGKVTIVGKLSPFLELGVGFNQDLSARDNVYLGGSILGLTKKEIDGKFDKIIAFAELQDFVDMKFRNFSSGMQVRLAFALAINAHADILLMDEVLAVGDTNFQLKCMEEFNRYKEEGKTVILVSHDVEAVKNYSDRVMLLRSGKVSAIGKPSVVIDKYYRENFSDENKNQSEENEIPKTERWGNKAVTFTSIVGLDQDNNPAHVFRTDERVCLRVGYKNNAKINDAVFGIEIYNKANKNLMFAYNTGMSGQALELDEKIGLVNFDTARLPLLDGKYFINLGVANRDCRVQYEYWEHAHEFTVMNPGVRKKMLGPVYFEMKVK